MENLSQPILKRGKLRTFLMFHVPAVAYAALIYYVSSLPDINPPSFGTSWDDKIYHFSEYAVFSFFIYIALKYYRHGFIGRYIHIWSAVIACLFAVSDEIHQYYVPGRDATYGDLLADCLGCISIQILLFFILRNIRQKRID